MRVVLLVMSLVFITLSSCAGATPVTDITERITGRGWSILPPQQQGWVIHARGQEGIDMIKRGENKDESYSAQIKMNPTAKELPLWAYVQARENLEYPPERVEFIGSKDVLQPDDKSCHASYKMYRDHGARELSDNPEPMIIKNYSMYCIHPHSNDFYLAMRYSHRYYQENEDLNFDSDAQEFFSNVTLDRF